MIRLAIRVRRQDAELVLAELLELAPSGVEEMAVGEDVIEYAVYGPPGEIPTLPDVEAAAGGALVQVSTTEVADDWSERWREFHQPLHLGDRLTVRAPWHPPVSNSDSIDLVIDPGQAFGTGAHATTRMCLELMLGLAPPAAAGTGDLGPFLDLGCGSGVLGIAAQRLGWSEVLALDYDPLCIEATRVNAQVNGVMLDASPRDLREPEPGVPLRPTIAANLLGPLLLGWARQLMAGPPPAELPQNLIVSGLLITEAERVADAFAPLGLSVAQRRERGEWAALLLTP